MDKLRCSISHQSLLFPTHTFGKRKCDSRAKGNEEAAAVRPKPSSRLNPPLGNPRLSKCDSRGGFPHIEKMYSWPRGGICSKIPIPARSFLERGGFSSKTLLFPTHTKVQILHLNCPCSVARILCTMYGCELLPLCRVPRHRRRS